MKQLRIAICAIVAGALLAGCARSPEARRDRFLAAGKQFLSKGDNTRALLEFRNASKAVPKDAEPYSRMGDAYRALRDYNSAVKAYRKALDMNPKYTEAQLRLSQIYAMTNDAGLWSDAQKRLQALLEGAPENSDALNALALTELKLGKTQTAVQTLERVLVSAPGELQAAYLLASTELSQKDPKGAEEVLKRAAGGNPPSVEAHLLLGQFYLNQNRAPEAEAEMGLAVSADPKNGEALMDFARLQLYDGKASEAEQNFKKLAALPGYEAVYPVFLFEQGRRDEALREFERLHKESPDDRGARTRLMVAYRMGNRLPEAEKLLAEAIKKNPKDADALLQRAEIRIERRDFAQAEQDLNEILHLRPKAPEAHYVLAKLNQEQGKALIYRQELIQTLQLNPLLLAVRLELAQNLIESKQGRAALDILNATPESQKGSKAVLVERNWALWLQDQLAEMRKGIDQGLARGTSTELLIQDGLWKLRSGDSAGARTALEAALKLDPSDVRALRALNNAYGNNAAALEKVKAFAASQPKSAEVQDFLGLTLLTSGDRKGARQALESAAAADPKFVKARLSLAMVDVAEGKIDDARQRLQAVLASEPNNVMARQWLGNLEEMKGNHTAAIDHFRKVVAATQNDPQAANNLAYLLVEYANQTDEALKYAQRAVELAPEHAAYCDTLGWVFYKKGMYAAAIPYFERAIAHPESVVPKYHLAMAYAKAGDKRRGKTMLEAALKQNPRVREAKSAQEVVGTR
jgi:tetratricopeptide (TPR) repeat protein